MACNLRHPMGLRHPICELLRSFKSECLKVWFANMGVSGKICLQIWVFEKIAQVFEILFFERWWTREMWRTFRTWHTFQNVCNMLFTCDALLECYTRVGEKMVRLCGEHGWWCVEYTERVLCGTCLRLVMVTTFWKKERKKESREDDVSVKNTGAGV